MTLKGVRTPVPHLWIRPCVYYLLQGEDPQEQKQKEIRQTQKEVSGQEEKRARSGRRRTQGEPSNIEPVREDPFDHRERVNTVVITIINGYISRLERKIIKQS